MPWPALKEAVTNITFGDIATNGQNAAYLELLGTRWRKVKELFASEYSAFQTFLVLILINILDKSMICYFELQQEHDDQNHEKRKRKNIGDWRLWGKSSSRKNKNSEPRRSSRPDIVAAMESTRQTTFDLWKLAQDDSVFEAKGFLWALQQFWPSQHPRDEMYFQIRTAICNCIAQIYLRFLFRWSYPPYSLHALFPDDVDSNVIDECMGRLLGHCACCLDVGWSRRVYQHLKNQLSSATADRRRAFLTTVYRRWVAAMRAGSLKEEWSHSIVRHLNVGDNLKSHESLQIGYAIKCIAQAFEDKIGKPIQVISNRARSAAAKLNRRMYAFRKPNDMGKPIILKMNEARKTEEWRNGTAAKRKEIMEKVKHTWQCTSCADKRTYTAEYTRKVSAMQ